MQSQEFTKSWSASADASAISSCLASFESELNAVGVSAIETWLNQVPLQLQAQLFVELLKLELEFHKRRGTERTPAHYRERFPEFEPQIRDVFSEHQRELPKSSHEFSMVSTMDAVARKVSANDPIGTWKSGDTVGRYRLDELVGRGGFGEVWRGFDPELNRTVAVKVPRDQSSRNSNSSKLFLDEARRAALIQHEGIVPVFDVGKMETGFFIVSEFIAGPTLAQHMLAGAIPREEAIQIVRELALILHKAHQSGLIHRDIKPSNILLRKDGSPTITDFGLAVSEEDQLSLECVIVGTLPYMSPEQARGETRLMDGRSDLYSLGVILFQLLTRRMPFQYRSHTELLEQIRNREVRSLRVYENSIPAALDEICLKCLAKEISSRYVTGQDLADALDHWNRPLPKRNSASLATVTALAAAACFGMFAIAMTSRGGRNEPAPNKLVDLKGAGANASPIGEWLPMLDRPLETIVSPKGKTTDFLQHDQTTAMLTARAEETFWILATPHRGQPPLRVRGTVFVDNWVGSVGFVWGLPKARGAFPVQPPHCYACVIERFHAHDPLTLTLRVIDTKEWVPDMLVVGEEEGIATTTIEFPTRPLASVEIAVEEEKFQVLIDGQVVWEPEFLVPQQFKDLSTTQGQVGIVLRGKTVVVRDAMTLFLNPQAQQ